MSEISSQTIPCLTSTVRGCSANQHAFAIGVRDNPFLLDEVEGASDKVGIEKSHRDLA